jgi:hypothetical protein
MLHIRDVDKYRILLRWRFYSCYYFIGRNTEPIQGQIEEKMEGGGEVEPSRAEPSRAVPCRVVSLQWPWFPRSCSAGWNYVIIVEHMFSGKIAASWKGIVYKINSDVQLTDRETLLTLKYSCLPPSQMPICTNDDSFLPTNSSSLCPEYAGLAFQWNSVRVQCIQQAQQKNIFQPWSS